MHNTSTRSRINRRLVLAVAGTASLALAGIGVGSPAAARSVTTASPAAGCASLPTEGDGSLAGMADDPAGTAAGNNPELTTLVAAAEAAGLVDTLNGEGPFTIFAPVNAAFEAVPEADLQAALADPTGVLTDILSVHVVGGAAHSSLWLAAEGEVETLNGTLTFAVDGDTLTVTGGGGVTANVVCADIHTANATVHLIDAVLQPWAGGESPMTSEPMETMTSEPMTSEPMTSEPMDTMTSEPMTSETMTSEPMTTEG